ncbi:hypothetical protein RHMOL_Rhmol04G0235500 [Rhododendron molle]|uniref:Uncharacterized protein n=1 Tax=Rhododendron molle TaxID=49168 RepID=A0ACC0P5S5_RHOML|nr:hypothetical protein RHMOL_Rhmol04G0235500 [Rhododendron molle]
MAAHSDGFDRIVIAGLASFTFYIPGRILRQLGISQENNRVSTGNFRLPNFNAQILGGYQRRWGLGGIQTEDAKFTPRQKNRYKKWLRAEVEPRQNIN